jgi:hypothetical protein
MEDAALFCDLIKYIAIFHFFCFKNLKLKIFIIYLKDINE